MKFDSVPMQPSERGASIAIIMLVGNGASRLDKFRWLERGARRFVGTQGSALAAGIMTNPLANRLPGFCPAVHLLDVSQWTPSLGPVARRHNKHAASLQAGTLAASMRLFHIKQS
jgi:hypothetical protein